MSNRVIVRLSEEAVAAARKLAGQRDADLGETLDTLVTTGVSRLAALAKYAKKTAPRRAKASAKKKAARKKKGPQPRRSKKKAALLAKHGPMKRKRSGKKVPRPLAAGAGGEKPTGADTASEAASPQSAQAGDGS